MEVQTIEIIKEQCAVFARLFPKTLGEKASAMPQRKLFVKSVY
jgi:hypothetical protein